MTSVDHVLLTRFNLPSGGAESRLRADPAWLDERMVLFERYCLPSVQRQTLQERLYWIVYLDPESPAWLKQRMEQYAAESPLRPIYREEVPQGVQVADARRVVGEPGDSLITTNLDNDDALAANFSARVRAATGADVRAIYVDEGLVLGPGGAYLQHDPINAFCSVAAPWSTPVTCWSAWHTDLEQHMPAVHLSGAPGWLQVIHGRNVSNRVKGRLVSPHRFRGLFPGLLEDVPDPTRRQLAVDRAVRAPARVLRESARSAIKRVLLMIGGRKALQRGQESLVALRSRARRQSGEPPAPAGPR